MEWARQNFYMTHTFLTCLDIGGDLACRTARRFIITKLCGFSQQENYTDEATAACRRS
jgi:hypothetical protein